VGRKQPLWIERIVVDAIHFDLLRTHGGLHGMRGEAALESALARPRQRWASGRGADLARLAAAYGFGLARNHPYRDGNKRIAFMVMAVLLGLNGLEIAAEEEDVVTTMVNLAAGKLTEATLARWVRSHAIRSHQE
jgi:death-on-curing protein